MPPDDLKKRIADAQKKLGAFDWPVRWEASDKLHITLRFLGSLTDHETGTVSKLVGKVSAMHEPFSVHIKDFLVLPRLEYPRVISVFIKPFEALESLQFDIARAIDQVGIGEPEKHDFTAHITIGRVKPLKKNYRALTKMRFSATLDVDSVAVMESTLSPHGSEYRIIERFSLTNT